MAPPPSLKVRNRAPVQGIICIPYRISFVFYPKGTSEAPQVSFHSHRTGPELDLKEGGGSAAAELTIHPSLIF